jgi:hypothetical protein
MAVKPVKLGYIIIAFLLMIVFHLLKLVPFWALWIIPFLFVLAFVVFLIKDEPESSPCEISVRKKEWRFSGITGMDEITTPGYSHLPQNIFHDD